MRVLQFWTTGGSGAFTSIYLYSNGNLRKLGKDYKCATTSGTIYQSFHLPHSSFTPHLLLHTPITVFPYATFCGRSITLEFPLLPTVPHLPPSNIIFTNMYIPLAHNSFFIFVTAFPYYVFSFYFSLNIYYNYKV